MQDPNHEPKFTARFAQHHLNYEVMQLEPKPFRACPALLLLFALCSAPAMLFGQVPDQDPSAPELLSALDHGPLAVGFKSMVLFDTSRTYDLNMGDTTLAAKPSVGRPILVNVWYPTAAPNDLPIRVRELFEFPTNDTIVSFIDTLKEYSTTFSKWYCADQYLDLENLKAGTGLLDDQREQLQAAYWDKQTSSYRNANPMMGDHPLVIYHQGLGGTIDESWMLLEYLASHGMVCVSSAFQDNDSGSEVGVGDLDATVGDIGFLIRHRTDYAPNSSDQVVLMGHSYGANYIPCYVAQGNRDVNSLVLLDNDLARAMYDFVGKKDSPFTDEKKSLFDFPIYCAAQTGAEFYLLDRFTSAARTYITVEGMEHDQFTSLGAACTALSTDLIKEPKERILAASNYPLLCESVLKFILHATGRGQALTPKDIENRSGWWYQYVAPGEVLAHNEVYVHSATTCPTPTQFVKWMLSVGPDSAAQVFLHCEATLIDTNYHYIDDYLQVAYQDFSIEEFIAFLSALDRPGEPVYTPDVLFTLCATWLYHSDPVDRKELTERAFQLGDWMMETFPDRIEGPMAVAMLQFNEEPARDYKPYYERILKIEPGILDRKPKNGGEQFAQAQVRHYLKVE